MGMNPEGIGAAMSGSLGNMMPQIMYWVGIILVSAIILGGFYMIFLFTQYKYKVTIFVRGSLGSSDKDDHSIGKVINKRIRIIKDHGIEKMSFLFSKKKIDPVELKYIMPGNRLFLYQTGLNDYIPVQFSCGNPEAYFNPLKYSIRRWQNLEIQEAFRDYQEQTFMQKYGGMLVTMGAIMFVLIFVGSVIWMNYNYMGAQMNEAISATNSLADSMKNYGAQRFGG